MKKTQYFVLLIVVIVSCVGEDYFKLSDTADIISIQVSNQNGAAKIDAVNDSVYIEIANGSDINKIVLQTMKLSPFATANIAIGDTLNFGEGSTQMILTAESGVTTQWKISVFEIGSQPQIENSDFSVWHQQGSYLDPGESDTSSAWGTSNPGATFGGMDPNVQRIELEPNNYAAKLTTRYTLLGSFVNKPIAAGSIFTGDFMEGNISFDDPQASIDFGIPFTASPKSFSVDYKFTPGPTNINAKGKELPYADTGDMYILLERREDGVVKRVATAWYRIEEANQAIKHRTIPFIYGELPIGTPEYMLPLANETYALSGEAPTHIKAVFSSSANGNIFEGAESSELIIDNVVLNY